MDELVQFLRARLEEDKQAARAATPGPWVTPDHDDQVGMLEVRAADEADLMVGYVADVATADALHIARHDPARVLRDNEAKRGIVDDLASEIHWGARSSLDYQDAVDAFKRTLKRLALPYADHPSYRAEWRP